MYIVICSDMYGICITVGLLVANCLLSYCSIVQHYSACTSSPDVDPQAWVHTCVRQNSMAFHCHRPSTQSLKTSCKCKCMCPWSVLAGLELHGIVACIIHMNMFVLSQEKIAGALQNWFAISELAARGN